MRFLIIYSILTIILFNIIASASGRGKCSANGVVTKIIDKKKMGVLVKIKGTVNHFGDSAGCALINGREIDVQDSKELKVDDIVKVFGSCINSFPTSASCKYSATKVN